MAEIESKHLFIEETEVPSFLVEEVKTKDKVKRKYAHVESKVKEYINNIKKQNVRVSNNELNTSESTDPESEIEAKDRLIAEMQLHISVLRKQISELLESNAEKDLKVDYFRLELTNLKSNAINYKAYNSTKFSSDEFSTSESEMEEPLLNNTIGVQTSIFPQDNVTQQILIPSKSKLKRLHKAGKKAISNLFKCREINNSQSIRFEMNQMPMTRIESKHLVKSLHTPKVTTVRRINFDKNSATPNVLISTPAVSSKLRPKLQKHNLFVSFNDADAPPIYREKNHELDDIIRRLHDVKANLDILLRDCKILKETF